MSKLRPAGTSVEGMHLLALILAAMFIEEIDCIMTHTHCYMDCFLFWHQVEQTKKAKSAANTRCCEEVGRGAVCRDPHQMRWILLRWDPACSVKEGDFSTCLTQEAGIRVQSSCQQKWVMAQSNLDPLVVRGLWWWKKECEIRPTWPSPRGPLTAGQGRSSSDASVDDVVCIHILFIYNFIYHILFHILKNHHTEYCYYS